MWIVVPKRLCDSPGRVHVSTVCLQDYGYLIVLVRNALNGLSDVVRKRIDNGAYDGNCVTSQSFSYQRRRSVS